MDLVNKYQVLQDARVRANASPDEIVSRGHHHSASRGEFGDWHSHDGTNGDTARDGAHSHVAGLGAHWTDTATSSGVSPCQQRRDAGDRACML